MEAIVHPVSQLRTKRQYRSVEERRRIVEETLVPGVSVATVARVHGVNANQVFAWRKLYHSGLLGSSEPSGSEAVARGVRLLPVTVSAEIEHTPAQPAVVPSQQDADRDTSSGSIELTLATARLLISGQVDTAALRVILESLRA
jgi:transposase